MSEWGNLFCCKRIEKLEKAVDKACDLLYLAIENKTFSVKNGFICETREEFKTREEWKEYLLNEVKEDE